jgi:hypothetical protein
MLHDWGFDFWQGQDIFFFFKMSRLAFGPTKPFLWVCGGTAAGM